MSQYNKLYTAQDSAVVFIDHQPQMLFGVSGIDRAALINNVTLLARTGKEFGVPTVLTAVETEGFSGYVFPQLLDIFPGQPVVERSSMNSWDDPGFRKAIEATGRKNILMTGLWTEVCITWPTIEMLGAGYNIYVVEDCCGATSPAAQEAALSRMVQAGAVRLTTIAALPRMAARLGEKGTLRRTHETASTAGRCLRCRCRVCLHHGSSRAAIRAKAASRAKKSALSDVGTRTRRGTPMNTQTKTSRRNRIDGMASLVVMLLLACSSLSTRAGKVPASFT